MKNMIDNFLDKKEIVQVTMPQRTFKWGFSSGGMETRHFVKSLEIKESEFKAVLNGERFYPYGYIQ